MPAWLEHTVFYEIYPQSFCDSNGDGIGDLRGIREKLPYLHDLGITGIWLNPCFESPFRDAGCDISDFYKVAPRYGSNDDLHALFAEARRLGIRVMLDLVAGHTSDQHPWFQASQRHERNRYTDWYIWMDSVWTWSAPGKLRRGEDQIAGAGGRTISTRLQKLGASPGSRSPGFRVLNP
jgi:maltose alpha-D-glucosyltransferase/alpha-amylase